MRGKPKCGGPTSGVKITQCPEFVRLLSFYLLFDAIPWNTFQKNFGFETLLHCVAKSG